MFNLAMRAVTDSLVFIDACFQNAQLRTANKIEDSFHQITLRIRGYSMNSRSGNSCNLIS